MIELFLPCFIDQIYPEIGFDCLKIFERCGLKTNYNILQTCCGQVSYNSGYTSETRSLALKFISEFEKGNKIVAPSASCIAFIKNYYPKLFDKESNEWNSVMKMRTTMFELSDFLVNDVKFIDFGATFPHKVTFHDGCSALREYGLTTEARLLLSNVKGLELIEMDERDTCCGFGGTFSVKHKYISQAMVQQKVEHALRTGAEFITSTEASCLINIESYIKKNKINMKTIHFASIISKGW